jgi:hypothetical protein
VELVFKIFYFILFYFLFFYPGTAFTRDFDVSC